MTSATTGSPPIAEQLAAVEQFLGRQLPPALREFYVADHARRRGLLPLSTGRERGPALDAGSNAEKFLHAQERLASALGHTLGQTEACMFFDDHVWPAGLLVIEDVGCAVYRAVDLDDPNLRVVEYEYSDPVDDPDAVTGAARLAFREPHVPRKLQHRFTVVADSFDDWLRVKNAPHPH